MARQGRKPVYVCGDCGESFLAWQGQCTSCSAWNTLAKYSEAVSSFRADGGGPLNQPYRLSQTTFTPDDVMPTGLGEVDMVCGSGLPVGAMLLLGGEPGIGKSTLALQVSLRLARAGKTVLYVTGEESVKHIFLRAKRLGEVPETLLVLSENNIVMIEQQMSQLSPDLLCLDSIQTVYHPDMPSVAGSMNQVRHCATVLGTVLKQKQITGLLIGHITKDGQLAGPKTLEHLVDIVLQLEGDRNQPYRLLRCFKNRYANTDNVGVFRMEKTGLATVSHASALFIDDRTSVNPGCVLSTFCEGNRVFLIEVQALVIESGYGTGKRTIVGMDPNRAHVMIAVLEKIMHLPLSKYDIVLNTVGGRKVTESALDLAIVLAILSSIRNEPLSRHYGVIGEVGLTGEVRMVPQLDKRLAECHKMGLVGAIMPEVSDEVTHSIAKTFNCKPLADIRYAIDQVFDHERHATPPNQS